MSGGVVSALRATVLALLGMFCLNLNGPCWAQQSTQRIYRPVAEFYHSGKLDESEIDTLVQGCELGLETRCLHKRFEKLQEAEAAVESDPNLVALVIEVDNSGPKTIVYLRVSCHEHHGRILRAQCGLGDDNGQCLASAITDFKKAIMAYDRDCQRGGVSCRADLSEHVVH